MKVYYEGALEPCLEPCPLNLVKPSFRSIAPTLSFNEYQQKVQKILDYLRRGAIYEVNFTMEFCIHDLDLEPISFYFQLVQNAQTPQCGILKWGERWLFCASQERFLKKGQAYLVSQPIKGTLPRTPLSDYSQALQLHQSLKNRTENVMIVDLVRNDLSRCCVAGSVKVERLYEIQTYPYLHQMVSTICGEPAPNARNFSIIKDLFPAGSMTGCPKIRAMQIIEELEVSGRGIYSGSIGYFHQGTFDLNVVIRSLVWDAARRLGSFHVGGAITLNSDIQNEYEECFVKSQALVRTLQSA